MSTASPASPASARSLEPGAVLADLLPGALTRDAVLVVGGAALVGICAQVSVPLPFTPVPFTLQTFAVLLTSAALGWRRGTAAMALYAVAGVAGVPWFAEHSGGSGSLSTAAFGYVLSFIAVGAVVGALAQRRADRTPLRAAASMVAGTIVVYAVGVTWLMADLHVGLGTGLALGMTPFLIGDAVKILLAAALLPGAWQLVARTRG